MNVFSYHRDSTQGLLCNFYGENQFDTAREYQYHDAITHARNILKSDGKILILGGGDLMTFRFLKNFDVTLVDIDTYIVESFKTQPLLKSLNHYDDSNKNFKILI